MLYGYDDCVVRGKGTRRNRRRSSIDDEIVGCNYILIFWADWEIYIRVTFMGPWKEGSLVNNEGR